MTRSDANELDAAASPKVLVWDVPTRIFHWAVVCLVGVSWYTADNELLTLHLWSGAALLTLIIFRIAWGFMGSTTARFSTFIKHPRHALNYLLTLGRSEEKPLYAGHNPAGGWMVVTFLSILFAQALTGVFSNDDLSFQGSLAYLIGKDASDRVTDLHGVGFNLILALIWLHVVAVCFHWLVKGKNLIVPMFTGKKCDTNMSVGLTFNFARTKIALLLLTASAVFVGLVIA